MEKAKSSCAAKGLSSHGHGTMTHDDAHVTILHALDVAVHVHHLHSLAGSASATPDGLFGGLNDMSLISRY